MESRAERRPVLSSGMRSAGEESRGWGPGVSVFALRYIVARLISRIPGSSLKEEKGSEKDEKGIRVFRVYRRKTENAESYGRIKGNMLSSVISLLANDIYIRILCEIYRDG